MKIQHLLSQRNDLSTFLVHLTRDYPDGVSAKDNLKSILENRMIEARNPYGSAISRLHLLEANTDENLNTQKVVCFTETPLEHVHLLTQEVEGRQFKFKPFGIAIPKSSGRSWSVNPVWYIDITPGHSWLTTPLQHIIDERIKFKDFSKSDIAKLAPFIEQMGNGPGYFKEYWWEREWRHLGDFALVMKFIVICPEEDYDYLVDSILPKPSFIDSRWSLEQIIGRLAGYKSSDIYPF